MVRSFYQRLGSIPSPSMRRPVSVKTVFLFLIRGFFSLSRAASVAVLPSALFGERLVRSVQVGRPEFSRCCYLIIDLGFHLLDGSWARWDEKAGLQRDAIRSQCSTCSRHKEKETGL